MQNQGVKRTYAIKDNGLFGLGSKRGSQKWLPFFVMENPDDE